MKGYPLYSMSATGLTVLEQWINQTENMKPLKEHSSPEKIC